MNKAQILKQTGLTEQEFYKLYPTQESYQMAMGGRMSYAYGGGMPPDEGTSYVQYDEAGNPITANQMYSNKSNINIPGATTTTNWSQQDENNKLSELSELKKQREALAYNLKNAQNEVGKNKIQDELNKINDKINHWETYGVESKPEGMYYVSNNEGMRYSEGVKNEGMHYSEVDNNSFDDMSFNSAFGAARKQGLKTFTWRGKSYGTNLAKSNSSGTKMAPPVVSEIKGYPKKAFGGRISYADGGQNLAGNLGQQGYQNNQVKADNIYLTSGEAGLAAFAENMPIIGGMVKAQNNKLGAREQIDRKGGMGAGAGQAFSQAVDIGLSAIGGPKLSGGKSTDSSYAPKDVTKQLNTSPTQNLAWETNNNGGLGMPQNNTLIDPNTTDPNSYVTPELNPMFAAGGLLDSGHSSTKHGTYNAANRIMSRKYADRYNYSDLSKLTEAPKYGGYNYAIGGQLTEVNTGGTHEQNSLGGVPVGKSASVEQNESMSIGKDGKPDFVFPDRIKLDKETAAKFDLSGVGKSFDKLARAASRVSDLRTDDKLDKELVESRLAVLKEALEYQKAKEAQKHLAKAMDLAPEMFQAPQEQMPPQGMGQGMGQGQMPMQDPGMEQMMAQQGQGMPQGMPQQPMMASGGSLNFKSSGAYNKWLGYVHANKLAENTPGNQKVSIGGQPHKVNHALGGRMQYAYGDPIKNLFVGPQLQDNQSNPYSIFTPPNTNVILKEEDLGYSTPDLQGTQLANLNTNVSPETPLFREHTNPLLGLRKSPREFEGVPPVFGDGDSSNVNPNENGYYSREISNIPLPSDKYDKASLAMLGMNAIANLGAAANMRGPRTSGSVNFDRINTYGAEQAARMAANDAIANTRDAARNAGASQAQYLGSMPGNIAQASATAAGEINNIKLRGQQANANIQMQEAIHNKQNENEMKKIQDMSDAQKVNQISKISGKTVESVNEVMKGMSARERDMYTLQWMNQENYGIASAEDAKKYGVKEGSYFYHAPKNKTTTTTDTTPTIIYDNDKGEWVIKQAYGGKISKKFGGKMKNC